MKFLDQAKIYTRSGNGGPGAVSFRREAHVPFGGPDGGDGGRGGDIVAMAVNGLNTLIDYRYQQHFKADSGRPGAGRDRSGASGKDVTLRLPIGTQILSDDQQTVLADLTYEGQSIILAKGGIGGKGNAFFKSSTNRAPRKITHGEKGHEAEIVLRLKILADAGLVGFPNAGKSSLLRKISAAKPKVADYPFTTLDPKLGVVRKDDQELVVADIPGLIEDAHKGDGLGFKFLKHIERCHSIIHVIDVTDEDVKKSYNTITSELNNYDGSITKKNKIVVLNKCDLIDKEEIKIKKNILENETQLQVYTISTITGEGVSNLINHILIIKN